VAFLEDDLAEATVRIIRSSEAKTQHIAELKRERDELARTVRVQQAQIAEQQEEIARLRLEIEWRRVRYENLRERLGVAEATLHERDAELTAKDAVIAEQAQTNGEQQVELDETKGKLVAALEMIRYLEQQQDFHGHSRDKRNR